MVDFGCAELYSNMLSLKLSSSVLNSFITMHFKNFEFIKLKGLSSWNWCQPIRRTLLGAYEVVKWIWKPILDRLEYYKLRWPFKNRLQTIIDRILGRSKINRIFEKSKIDWIYGHSEIDSIFGKSKIYRDFGNFEINRIFGESKVDRIFG